MKNYKLLSENDLIPNKSYLAIVYYPYPSPNRNPMVEWVYYDQYRDWCGTDKDIAKIVDESVISVLFEYEPERACEIIEGGFTEDGYNNDILSGYDFSLQEKYDEVQTDYALGE